MFSPGVFVSYTREDRSFVEQILEILNDRGVPFFDYQRDLLEEPDLLKAIQKRLLEYDAVISIWSTDIRRSQYFQHELLTMMAADIPHCVIQIAGDWIDLADGVSTMIDATDDQSKAKIELTEWLERNGF